MRIGVISDTHGHWDPEIPRSFAGVEHILHAGDVGPQSLLLELERIAPVTAVLGNTDSFLNLRESAVVTLGAKRFLVQHIVDPWSPHEALKVHLKRVEPDVVVFGHTHKPFNEVVNGRLFFNPGYAGRTRFGMPRSLAILEWEDGEISARFLPLD